MHWKMMPALCLLGAIGCTEPITATTWINVDPDNSSLSAELLGQQFEMDLEGGVFAEVKVDISRLPLIRGTIDVQQVRMGGQGGAFGDLCLRNDPNNPALGTFEFNPLTWDQEIVFPFAVIASSSTLEGLGFGEIPVEAIANDVEVPLDPSLLDPLLRRGTMDNVLELPVAVEGDFEVSPTLIVGAVIDMLLHTSAAPPVVSSGVAGACKDKWALQGRELDYIVNSKGTYLRTLWDRPQPPTVIDLAELGAGPGDTLHLRRKGEFKKTGIAWDARRMAAVFSGSDRLRSTRYRDRVIDAIDAGSNVSTPSTRWWWRSTNISEDFEITDSLEIVVPAGATHLFITPIDNYFKDNFSFELRVGVEVECLGPDCGPINLCQGVVCDDGNVCSSDACNPLNGQCEFTDVLNGTDCDFDGLPGICQGGLCQDAMLCEGSACDDGNECTDNSCDPQNGQCVAVNVTPGSACDFNGFPGICEGGLCQDANLCQGAVCGDANECTDDSCNPLNGQCVNASVVDGRGCNYNGLPGICQGGLCQDANLCQGAVCDDGEQCTTDACDPQDGLCDNNAVQNGTACNYNGLPGICQGGLCQDANLCQGTVCDDDEQCTSDACDPQDGLCDNTAAQNGTACNYDGLPGVCQGGLCQDANLCQGAVCDDGEQCTTDACDPQDGLCDNDALQDDTPCNFNGLPGRCVSGACEDAMLCQGVACDDTNECTADACDPQDGVCDFNAVDNDTPCDLNGLPGICQAGVCQDAALCQGINCDDSEQCTADACDPQDGLCDFTAVTDDTPCNFNGLPGRCMGGVCEDAMLCQGVVCDDTNECTADLCDPQDGVCDFNAVPNDTDCDYNGFPGICQGGVCQDAMLCEGAVCDDGDQCTADACDPQDGLCDSTAVTDDTPCNFNGFPGRCTGGACEDAMLCQGVVCDDTNDCTADICDPQDGLCDSTAVTDDTPCNFDGLPGVCRGGLCEDAMLCQGVACDDSEQCTVDSCDPQDGLCDFTPVANDTPCNFSGLPGRCMSGVCEDAMLCQGVVCNDTNDCTADMCDPQDGQCDFNPVADDTPCGAGGSCTSGVCVVDPAPLTVVQNVNCTPLGIPVTVPVTLTVDPRGAFTSGGSATVDSVLDVVIDPSVGQLLINVFANDQATVGAAIVNVSVNGGTPSPIAHAVPGTPRVIDVDANDDGTADPVPLGTDTVTTIVTNDGSPNVSFSVTSISVQVTSPVNLTLDDTNCTVDPGSVSFPVN